MIPSKQTLPESNKYSSLFFDMISTLKLIMYYALYSKNITITPQVNFTTVLLLFFIPSCQCT